MIENRYSFGICSWCLPTDQDNACELAADIGLDGMEIDIGTFEDGLPLTDPDRQRSLLEAAKKLISFSPRLAQIRSAYTA